MLQSTQRLFSVDNIPSQQPYPLSASALQKQESAIQLSSQKANLNPNPNLPPPPAKNSASAKFISSFHKLRMLNVFCNLSKEDKKAKSEDFKSGEFSIENLNFANSSVGSVDSKQLDQEERKEPMPQEDKDNFQSQPIIKIEDHQIQFSSKSVSNVSSHSSHKKLPSNIYECVHHGRRVYKHEQGEVRSDTNQLDAKSLVQYFCEDCSEFCCEYCIVLGPHNTDMHRVSYLKEFAERYQEFIHEFLKASGKEKCVSLFNKMKQVNKRSDLISNQSLVIERDAFIQFTHILERLTLAEGKKISILQNDVARLQRDINTIEDAVKAFENLASQENRLPFLLFYRSLNSRVTEALSIHFKKEVVETPYDLPRELQGMKLQMENFKPHDEILKFKDIIIWGLIELRQKSIEEIQKQQIALQSKNLETWTKLALRTFQEFEGLQLICHYCGELINEDIINSDCFANLFKRDRDMSIPLTVYTDATVEKGIYGTKRHYWSYPRINDRQIKLGKLPNILPELMFCIIKKRRMEKNMNLQEVLSAYDKEKTGFLTIIQFKYVLNALLELEEDFVNRTASFLGVTEREYQDKLESIQEPDRIKHPSKSLSDNPFLREFELRQNPNVQIPVEPDVYVDYQTFLKIVENYQYLEYEAFKIIDFTSIKQHGSDFFITLDEEVLKKSNAAKMAEKKFGISSQNNFLSKTQRFPSGSSSHELASTLRNK